MVIIIIYIDIDMYLSFELIMIKKNDLKKIIIFYEKFNLVL